MSASEFRRCLEECDIDGVRKLWAHVSPHLPQPTSHADTLVIIHRARTQTNSIALNLRAYSHRWLLDQGYSSGLPDELKPSAERLYPKVTGAVGLSINVGSPWLKPIVPIVRGAMQDAVLEAEADGKLDDASHVKRRMMEAREYTMKKLIGR